MTELRIVARSVLLLAGALACAGALAQAAAPADAGSSASAADRAQKQADRTLYWIRVLAEKPAPKAAAAKPATPVAAQAPTGQAVAPARPAATAAAADARPAAQKVASVVTPVPSEVAAPASVTAAPPAATAPSMRLPGNGSAGAGVDTSPAVAAGLAAPTLTPPEIDVPQQPEVEEPDPGLIMTKSADPQFPMAAMRRLRKGEVEVKFEVGPDGQVDVVSVVRTTNPGLNNAALDAVRQWQFKPTPHGHTAVVDLAFDLDS
jgi:TonB family protein